jgi:hypothetical protein
LAKLNEVQFTFRLKDETGLHTVELWINDARQNEAIMALVGQIGVLIEQRIGVEPVMK